MMIGFVLTSYDRTDDLLAHIDILKYYPSGHEVIPIWMNKESPPHFVKEMESHKNAFYLDGKAFSIGPLLGLAAGLRKAKELGLDYIVYRNGDDWMFNHELVKSNFEMMDREGHHVLAYNWLTYDSLYEFAMNELYIRVDKFMETVDEAEEYFLKSNAQYLCEFKIAKWMKKTLGKGYAGFKRLSDREFFPGVGYEIETLPKVLEKDPGPEFWENLKNNSRFFNKKWQLIGHHNNSQKLIHYLKIRNEISYAKELEREDNFSRWMKGGEWNMPSSKKKRNKRPNEKPLVFKALPKRLPKKVIGLGLTNRQH